jgi:hypothetical protein
MPTEKHPFNNDPGSPPKRPPDLPVIEEPPPDPNYRPQDHDNRPGWQKHEESIDEDRRRDGRPPRREAPVMPPGGGHQVWPPERVDHGPQGYDPFNPLSGGGQ